MKKPTIEPTPKRGPGRPRTMVDAVTVQVQIEESDRLMLIEVGGGNLSLGARMVIAAWKKSAAKRRSGKK